MNSSTVHVAVFDTLADWEIGYATAHIRRDSWQQQPGRYDIRTVGLDRGVVTTMGGMRVVPDIAIDELRPQDSAMLILAGGDTWAEPVMAPFRTTSRAFLEAGVPVAALCGATYGLALQGLLDERAHTSNAAEYLAMSGYRGASLYREEPVVRDGNLITAGSTEPVRFARAVFEALELYSPALTASWFKLYGEHDPVGFYELLSA